MDLKAKCRIIGIKSEDVLPGELFRARDDRHAAELVEAGIAEVYDPQTEERERLLGELEAKEKAKVALLTAIAAAQTVEDLTALMPEEEPEPEIVEAFNKRMDEIDEDGAA